MEQLQTLLIALAVAVVSYLISYFQNRKLKENIRTIEEALQSDDAEYYVICPKCQSKIVLSKVKILVDKQQSDANK